MIVLDLVEISRSPPIGPLITGDYGNLYTYQDGYQKDILHDTEAMESYEVFEGSSIAQSSGLTKEGDPIFIALAIFIPRNEFEIKTAAVFVSRTFQTDEYFWECTLYSSSDLSGIQEALRTWEELHDLH